MDDLVLCIGAAHWDRKARAQAPIALKSSIPVVVEPSLGGVARNVAEILARLQHRVSLLTCLGADPEGEKIRLACHAVNIELESPYFSQIHPTASYTAILDESGEMILALADMAVYDEMSPSFFSARIDSILRKKLWFVDANLPEDGLRYLFQIAREHHIRLFVDPVSVPKAKKLLLLLNGIDFLFPNKEEAEVLSGVPIRDLDDAVLAGKRLVGQGVNHAIITLGAQGVVWVSKESARHFPAIPARVVDVTGAGDALIGGMIHGLLIHQPLDVAIRYGLAAASLAVETAETVCSRLNRKTIAERAAYAGTE